jgi:hypothetical protein
MCSNVCMNSLLAFMRRVPQDCGQEVVDLLNKCLASDACARPCAYDLMCFLARHLGSRLQKELIISSLEDSQAADDSPLAECKSTRSISSATLTSLINSESDLSMQSNCSD